MFEDFIKRITQGFGGLWRHHVFNQPAGGYAGGRANVLYSRRADWAAGRRLQDGVWRCRYCRRYFCVELERLFRPQKQKENKKVTGYAVSITGLFYCCPFKSFAALIKSPSV